MDVDAFLREIGNRRGYRGQMVHVHDVPARRAGATIGEPLVVLWPVQEYGEGLRG